MERSVSLVTVSVEDDDNPDRSLTPTGEIDVGEPIVLRRKRELVRSESDTASSLDNFDLTRSNKIEINLVTPIALSAGILSQVVLWVFQEGSHEEEGNEAGARKQKLYISDFGHGTTNDSNSKDQGNHFHRFSVSDAKDNNLILLYRYIEGAGRCRWVRTVVKTGKGDRIGEFSKLGSRPYHFRIWPVYNSVIRTENQMTYHTQYAPSSVNLLKNDERIFNNSCTPLLNYNKDTTKFMSFHWKVDLERDEKLVLLGLVVDMALSYAHFNYCSTCRVIHMTLNAGPRNVTIRFGNDYTLKRIHPHEFMYGD